jgi:FPC/CPF motif-containing protein YcgG
VTADRSTGGGTTPSTASWGGRTRSGAPAAAAAVFIHRQFRALADKQLFPCTGATSTIQQGGYRIGVYEAMASGKATAGLAYDLFDFVREQPSIPAAFTTFVAVFREPPVETELHFEQLLWRQLQLLHDLDSQIFAWDSSVSADPSSPSFAFSFAGRAFFIVGLHSASSRWARRFAWPTIVFNAHFQFDRLRETGALEKMKRVIRQRDERLQGSLNPNLADFGEVSEARQYSGRPAPEGWRCPFAARARAAGAADVRQGPMPPAGRHP